MRSGCPYDPEPGAERYHRVFPFKDGIPDFGKVQPLLLLQDSLLLFHQIILPMQFHDTSLDFKDEEDSHRNIYTYIHTKNIV
jgi:hypothetical protein